MCSIKYNDYTTSTGLLYLSAIVMPRTCAGTVELVTFFARPKISPMSKIVKTLFQTMPQQLIIALLDTKSKYYSNW